MRASVKRNPRGNIVGLVGAAFLSVPNSTNYCPLYHCGSSNRELACRPSPYWELVRQAPDLLSVRLSDRPTGEMPEKTHGEISDKTNLKTTREIDL